MRPSLLHTLHHRLGAPFTEISGVAVPAHYGDATAELKRLRTAVGWIDLSCRSRLCLTGVDRVRFLNGQVTNNIKDLAPGRGCYACLLNAKGKIDSDLNVYCLEAELLLDFEPGYAASIAKRLEQFIIADDVQVLDAAPHFGLLAVIGPASTAVVRDAGLDAGPPELPWTFIKTSWGGTPEVYVMNQPRGSIPAFDLYVPAGILESFAGNLEDIARRHGGGPAGWDALELLRVESGLPRFGVDMDETTLPPEAGLESRAISYTKGCYIGQEIISRIRTYGQVAKTLRGLKLSPAEGPLPKRGDRLFVGDKDVGFVTSAVFSPTLRANIALGYVRKEHLQLGTVLGLASGVAEPSAVIVPLPFV